MGRPRFSRAHSPDDEIELVESATDAATTGALIDTLEHERARFERGTRARVFARALRSPITGDATLLCQGLNYREHAAEAGHHDRR
jgi:2-keto-4-pentenoate hydratase/2-oxohepta-3-ene-1,7-dioic acid hydratase in catechol pathway